MRPRIRFTPVLVTLVTVTMTSIQTPTLVGLVATPLGVVPLISQVERSIPVFSIEQKIVFFVSVEIVPDPAESLINDILSLISQIAPPPPFL